MVGGGSALRSKRDMPENVPRRSESAMSDAGHFFLVTFGNAPAAIAFCPTGKWKSGRPPTAIRSREWPGAGSRACHGRACDPRGRTPSGADALNRFASSTHARARENQPDLWTKLWTINPACLNCAVITDI